MKRNDKNNKEYSRIKNFIKNFELNKKMIKEEKDK